MRSKNENMMRVHQQLYPYMDMSNPMMTPIGIGAFPMGMMNHYIMPPMDPSFLINPENQQNFDMNASMLNPMNINPLNNYNVNSRNLTEGNLINNTNTDSNSS